MGKFKHYNLLIPITAASLMFTTMSTTVYATQKTDEAPKTEQNAKTAEGPTAEEQAAAEAAAQAEAEAAAAQAEAEAAAAAQAEAEAAQAAAAAQAEGEAGAAAEAEAEAQAQAQPAQTTRVTRRTATSRTTTTQNQEETQNEADAESQENTEGEEGTAPQQATGNYKLTFTKNAHLRADASTSSASKVVVPAKIVLSSDVRVINENGETWYKASYAGSTGFVREDMVNVVEIPIEPPEDQEGGEQQDSETGQQESVGDGAQENAGGAANAEAQAATDAALETVGVATQNVETDDSASPTVTTISDTFISDKTDVPSRKGFDFIMFMFMVLALFLFSMAFFTYNRMRLEYRRLKGHVVRSRSPKKDND